MFKLKYTVSVLESDNAYKHVHHARLVELLELGRIEYFKSLNLPDYEGFQERGFLIVLSKLNIRFWREVRAGEVIITCEKPKLAEKRLTLRQRILDDLGNTALIAEVEQAVISVEQGKAVELPKFLREKFCRE